MIKYKNVKEFEQDKLCEGCRNKPKYWIDSKQFDRKNKHFIFVLESRDGARFSMTAREISKDKNLLSNLNYDDVYDVGYTSGNEASTREFDSLLALRRQKEKIHN